MLNAINALETTPLMTRKSNASFSAPLRTARIAQMMWHNARLAKSSSGLTKRARNASMPHARSKSVALAMLKAPPYATNVTQVLSWKRLADCVEALLAQIRTADNAVSMQMLAKNA